MDPALGEPPGLVTASARRRVASNTALQLAGKAAVLAMGAVSITVLTRYLGPDDYGRYTLALMYMQLFGVLADIGLYTTVVRDISKDPARTEELVGNALALRFALSIALIALGSAISLLLPYDPDVRLAIVLAGGPLLLGMLTTSLTPVLQSRLRMGRAASADVLGRAAALALVVLVATLDLGFYAVMGAAAGGGAVALVATYVLVRPLVRPRAIVDLGVWRALLRASIPLGIALGINQVYLRADTFIISLFEPYGQVGLYTLAYRILELTLVAGTVFLNTTFPIISDAITRDEPRARRAIQSSTDVLLVLGVPLVAGGLVLAPDVIAIAGGDDFADAATPLRILFAAGALAWLNGVFGFALIAKERQTSTLWLNVAGLVFNVSLNLLLIPRYGIVVAAVVTVASELLILVGSYFLMRRHIGFFPSLAILAPTIAAAAAMAGVLVLAADAPFAVLLVLGIASYAAILWIASPRARHLLDGVRA